MTLYSKNFKSISEMLDALQKEMDASQGNGFNASEFAGKVKWDMDALEYQKRMRDEWEEKPARFISV